MVAAGNYLIDESVEALHSIIDRSIIAYCSKSNQDPQLVLKPEHWFQDAINSVASISIP